MAGGRPTKLTEEILAKTDDYRTMGYESQGEVIPTVAGLGVYLGVAKSTIHKWADEDGQFSESYQQIMQEQEMKCVSRGLDGTFNPAVTKLVLHNHGYSDKVAQDNTSSDGSMTPQAPVINIKPVSAKKG